MMKLLILVLCAITTKVAGDPPTVVVHDLTVSEDAPIGTVIGQLTASDPDRLQALKFSIKDPETKALVNLSAPFIQNHRALADILVASHLDRDFAPETRTLKFVVSVGTTEVPVSMQLRITDVNDVAPIFTISNYTLTLKSDLRVGSIVAVAVATDPDKFNGGQVVYSVQTKDLFAFDAFQVDTFTGLVTLKSPLLAHAHRTLHFSVVATDGGGLSSRSDVTINVE